jgi:hypothetical protein
VSGGVEDIAARGANRIDEHAPQVTCDARAVMRCEEVRFAERAKGDVRRAPERTINIAPRSDP